jgi:hypothetical protein
MKLFIIEISALTLATQSEMISKNSLGSSGCDLLINVLSIRILHYLNLEEFTEFSISFSFRTSL